MLRLLTERQAEGVDIRIIGEVSGDRFPVRELVRMRLHTRVILRDRQQAFVGSQSLRQLELDARREIGVIFRDGKVIASLLRTFEEDWAASKPSKSEQKAALPVAKTAKKVAKAVSKNLAAAPVVKKVVRELRKKTNGRLGDKQVKQAVKEAVKETVKVATKQAVRAAVQDAAETSEKEAR